MPRLTTIPFPATRFVPGSAGPGPRPADHQTLTPHWPADPCRWQESLDYLWGIDLFNAGYCWEAHEALEAAWKQLRARGDSGATRAACGVRAIIQVAAARIKHQTGNALGVHTLLERVAPNIALAEDPERPGAPVMGIDLGAWHAEVRDWFAASAAAIPTGPAFPPLNPSDPCAQAQGRG